MSKTVRFYYLLPFVFLSSSPSDPWMTWSSSTK